MPRDTHIVAVVILATASGVAIWLGEGFVGAAAAMLALGVLAHRSRLASDIVSGDDHDETP